MIRRSRFLLYTAVLAIALLSGGCALTPVVVDTALGLMPTPQVEEPTPVVTHEPLPLEQTVWVLQSLNGVPPLPEEEVTLEFLPYNDPLGDVFRGNAICNSYGGLYEHNGQRLTILEFQYSLVRCPSIEEQYFDIFPRVSSYEIDGSTLTLTTDIGEILIFIRA
ncbi:META domain-containing protein [bacterium]|nr:META domain-containing protein [bacterium]